MQRINKIILARTALILTTFILVGFAAYIRTDSPGITFATYGIDLKIDNRTWYNGQIVPSSTWALKDLVPTSDKFFKFKDIKPGDSGKTLISTHVGRSDAWLCLDFSNLVSKDKGVNEPESLVDTNGNASGELAKGTEFFSWIDNGDGIFRRGEKVLFGATTQTASKVLNEKSYVIGDSGEGGSCKVNNTKYIGIVWCAGNLTVNLSTGAIKCDGSALGNEAQTDSFKVDMAIRAMPSKENKKFRCGTGRNPPPRHNEDYRNENDRNDHGHYDYRGNRKDH